MNRGVVESSGLNPNWWNMDMNMNTSRPPSNHQQQQLPPNNFHPPQIHQYYSSPCNWLPQTDTNNHQDQISAASWTQLFMSGLVGDEDKALMSHFNDQQQAMEDHVKQENSFSGFVNANTIEDHFLVGSKSNSTNCWSPQSCITTTTTTKTDPPPPAVERSFECNSSVNVNGGPIKKARVQSSSATQSTFKVRKFGDRITSLHQLVSPFGKTDTASVLLEAIGYIRFLESQIEALSIPYMGSGSGNNKKQQLPQSVKGERSCIFPEDPGQLLNENSLKRKGGPDQELGKDLRSRGLCLVPVSCTLNVGRENGADYWAPVLGGFR